MILEKKNPQPYFGQLDGLRFAMFIMVYLHHTIIHEIDLFVTKGSFLERVITTIGSGGTGVSVFFVLSGFLITYLLLHEKETKGKVNIKNFYIRRGLRIWPLYYLVIFFAATIFPILKSYFGNNFNLGLTQSYYYTFLSNLDVINIKNNYDHGGQLMSTVSWSVYIEEQFYLVCPLLFLFVKRKYYLFISPFIILLSLYFRSLHGDDDHVLYFHTFSVSMDLALGGLIGYLSFYDKVNMKLFFASLSKPTIVIIYILGFVWLL